MCAQTLTPVGRVGMPACLQAPADSAQHVRNIRNGEASAEGSLHRIWDTQVFDAFGKLAPQLCSSRLGPSKSELFAA